MSRPVEEAPTINQHGDEVHPGWGLIGANRVSSSGTTLFDSEIVHQHYVMIRIKAASRKRSHLRDWIHGGKTHIEVALSEAQWASFVSSFGNGDGVPCTVDYVEGYPVPPFPHDSRLDHSIQETKDAATRAFEEVEKAMAAYDALDPKAGVKERREALNRLRSTIQNAPGNVAFASKSLVEMAEDVVTKARADVEAFVIAKAQQLGLDAGDVMPTIELGSGNDV